MPLILFLFSRTICCVALLKENVAVNTCSLTLVSSRFHVMAVDPEPILQDCKWNLKGDVRCPPVQRIISLTLLFSIDSGANLAYVLLT